jgi:hypothetical protein
MHALLCFSVTSQGTQQQEIFRHPKVFIIFCTAHFPKPGLAMISLTITLQSSQMRTSTFCLLHSMVMVLGKLLQGRSVMSLSFEIFYPTLHIAGIHAGISIDTTKSIKGTKSQHTGKMIHHLELFFTLD